MQLGSAVWSTVESGDVFEGVVVSVDEEDVILAAPPIVAPGGRKYSCRTVGGGRLDVVFVSVSRQHLVTESPCTGKEQKFSEPLDQTQLMKVYYTEASASDPSMASAVSGRKGLKSASDTEWPTSNRGASSLAGAPASRDDVVMALFHEIKTDVTTHSVAIRDLQNDPAALPAAPPLRRPVAV